MQSEEKARRVIQFIECLRHTKGEFHGQPFKLLPWQERIIRIGLITGIGVKPRTAGWSQSELSTE